MAYNTRNRVFVRNQGYQYSSGAPATKPPVRQTQPQHVPLTSASTPPLSIWEYQRQSEQGESSAQKDSTGFISQKIYKINTKDKVVDFSSKLMVAKVEDFANVHGCGGKGHAPNSTISITVCDYSRGIGENAVTVSYNADVEDMGALYHAAMDARLGKLTADPSVLISALSVARKRLRNWYQEKDCADGIKAIPTEQIVSAGKLLSNALSQTGQPAFVYSKEKNNPYRKDDRGYVPVSKVYIAYTPFRKNGEKSNYPWCIQVENFSAPLKERSNGSTAHDAKNAVNKRVANILLSADDFAATMVAVQRFVQLWEMSSALPVMRKAYKKLDEFRNQAGGSK